MTFWCPNHRERQTWWNFQQASLVSTEITKSLLAQETTLLVPAVLWLLIPPEGLQPVLLSGHGWHTACCSSLALKPAGKYQPCSTTSLALQGVQTQPLWTNGEAITVTNRHFLLMTLLGPQCQLLELIKTRQRCLLGHELKREQEKQRHQSE